MFSLKSILTDLIIKHSPRQTIKHTGQWTLSSHSHNKCTARAPISLLFRLESISTTQAIERGFTFSGVLINPDYVGYALITAASTSIDIRVALGSLLSCDLLVLPTLPR